MNFAGEIQSPSVGPVDLASAMFHATLTVATSNQLPAHQGCLSLIYFQNEPAINSCITWNNNNQSVEGKVTSFIDIFRCQSANACDVQQGIKTEPEEVLSLTKISLVSDFFIFQDSCPANGRYPNTDVFCVNEVIGYILSIIHLL